MPRWHLAFCFHLPRCTEDVDGLLGDNETASALSANSSFKDNNINININKGRNAQCGRLHPGSQLGGVMQHCGCAKSP
ncbi:hypothetical protein Cob_v009376 [Colletotrichum orbiculare MAFF 240422]|uniref:Uncharacterized protein n=1 Tax=Colletotrichum orbiculare (strain 104-T / ATCC 96160 / CBS 514.97 / LARS 414 / MAFF 240422) TaxID=1213857 RepID=A0A484FLF2_COLOR|nr:hypothetical protein Cob_v009376 [Colletotrichum orbiculare MAFF 240422]